MKLYKDDYVIEGSVQEIAEFLKEDLNKKNQYIILTENTVLFYKKPIIRAGGITERYYVAPKGTELYFIGKEKVSGFKSICSVYIDEKGYNVVIPETDVNDPSFIEFKNTFRKGQETKRAKLKEKFEQQ